jgi:predicted RNase H-like nuclease
MTACACVGVDGCKRGWVAVAGVTPELRVYRTFHDILADWPDAHIAVDMPIGLPERISGGGRSPEKLVRPMLGLRQSSVFAMPARAVVEMGGRMTGRTQDDYPLHQQASARAKTLSDPPKGVSIQGFYLFPKILEIDALLRADQTLRDRVKESHPEVAFTVLNGGQAMRLPKKIKGRVNAPGMEERRVLLARFGMTAPFLNAPPPPGVGADDVLDAAVCWLVAGRLARGEAVRFPDPPECDAHGLEIAIWA